MVRQNLSIYEVIEAKTVKGQVYHKISTDKGAMSCFDAIVGKDLLTNKGRVCDVETQKSGDYTNIIAFISAQGPAEAQTPKKPSKDSPAAMIISYVKDLVIADKVKMENFGDQAIKLMKLYKELQNVA